MKQVSKLLLLLEVLVCYGPAVCYLAIGLAFVPFWLLSALTGEFAALTLLLMVVGGVCGIIALVALVIKLLNPRMAVISAGKIRILSMFGMVASVAILLQTGSLDRLYQAETLVFLLPVVASVHIIYLGRNYYFSCKDSG